MYASGITDHTRGSVFAIIGVLALSPDALLLRKVASVPNFTVQFYRNLAYSFVMTMQLLVMERQNSWKKFTSLGRWGLFAGCVVGINNLFMVLALQHTAVANVLVIRASSPIFSTFFSYLILNEKLSVRTGSTCVVCIGAIVLIFASEFNGKSSDVLGLLFALGSSILFGLYLVLMRWLTIYQK